MSRKKKVAIFLVGSLFIILNFQDGTLFRRRVVVSPATSQAASAETAGRQVAQENLVLVTEPDQGLTPIEDAIRGAQTSVELVMYELEDTQIEKLLADAKSRGVSVRVLLNGGYYGVPDEPNKNEAAYEYLQSHGVPVGWTPGRFALTHQKTLVVDGATAYIMTGNMSPQYYASDRDFIVRDADATDVPAIEETFDTDWNNQNTSAPTGDDLLWSPDSEDDLVALIGSAEHSLEIYNEEMNDTKIVNALVSAAKRRVTVEVVMTDQSSWHKNFQKLKTAGVQVHTFSAKAPLYIHAKVIVADDATAFLGSENFSPTSLLKNRELGIITSDEGIISQLTQTFQKDFANATSY